MNTLILEWIGNNGVSQRQTITDTDLTKIPGRFRIGRDRSQCDLEINHNTVSRLHIEILFSERQKSFFVRNLAPNNAPIVDGQRLAQGEMPLRLGSAIILGQVAFNVISVEESLAATVVVAPPPEHKSRTSNHQQQQHQQQQHQQQHNYRHHQQQQQHYHQHHQYHQQQQQAPNSYGLECPSCRKISDASYLNQGCRWCGTSLGAAVSVLLTPKRS